MLLIFSSLCSNHTLSICNTELIDVRSGFQGLLGICVQATKEGARDV